MSLKHPGQVIAEAIYQDGGVRGTADTADRILCKLREAGWHLVSTPEWIETDDPPIPDEAVEQANMAVRFASEGPRFPHREIRLTCHVDDKIADYRMQVDRWHLQRTSGDFMEYAKKEMLLKFGMALVEALRREQ